MTLSKTRSRNIVLLALLVVSIVAGYFIFIKSDGSTKQAAQTTNQIKENTRHQAETNPKVVNPADVDTGDLKYKKPAGWAKLSKKILDSSGSVSGIGRGTEPAAQFTIRTSSSIPANAEDLKSSTIGELKKLSAFELVSSTHTVVDGEPGQKFIYKFGGAGKVKVKQELNVIVHKQKTFFLLVSSVNSDFEKVKTELNNILSSIKFK